MNEETVKQLLKQIKELKSSTLTEKKIIELFKKEILDTSDMAILFSRKMQTIHRWRKKKLIECVCINGSYYYRWEAIDKMLNVNHQTS